MPTLAHEDDALRCVSAALEMEARIRQVAYTHPLAAQALRTDPVTGLLDVNVSIGVAAGTVYCGEAGSDVRCEYTAVGFTCILAARLMAAAKNSSNSTNNKKQGVSALQLKSVSGGILLDRDTVAAAAQAATICGDSYGLSFQARSPVQLKGLSKPVQVFRPYLKASQVLPGSKGVKLLGIRSIIT